MNETEAYLILNAVPGLTNARIRKLISTFGSAKRVLSIPPAELFASQSLPEKVVSSIVKFPKKTFLESESAHIIRNNISIIKCNDIDYPERLKEIPDAPVVLYVKGKIESLCHPTLAIVGSRRASIYGLSMAEKFAVELSELGFTVVSGMAKGIDAAAHRGCLKARGSTVAVVGCGLSNVYPSEHKRLSEEIVIKGAVISEFPMEALPLPFHFPQRNRIVSGLSLGVIVVEAAKKSGALITSDFALEQGREVFAVPGRISHPNAQGVHGLIKQGAKLAGCVEDIIEELSPQLEAFLKKENRHQRKETVKVFREPLTEPENKILKVLAGRPLHIDELAHQCGETMPLTTAMLLKMELKRVVRQLPGKQFVRRS